MKTMKKKKQTGSCESCMYYSYDEDYECYTCEVNLDEDEMAKFMQDKFYNCPYYRQGDEYLIVRKQCNACCFPPFDVFIIKKVYWHAACMPQHASCAIYLF